MNTTATIAFDYVDIDKLSPAEWNPREMPKGEMDKLKRSIKAFGMVDPIIARKSDGLIIGGHQRCVAAREIGFSSVPVVWVDLSDQEAKLLNVALNRIHGEWDNEKLTSLIEEIRTDGSDITLTGLDDAELASLEQETEGLTDPLYCDVIVKRWEDFTGKKAKREG